MSRPRFAAFISRRSEMADFQARRPGCSFVFASYAALGDDVYQVNPARPEAMIARFRALHRRWPFAGVLNCKEKCVVPAGLLANALGVRPILAQPPLARDKFLMRQALNGPDRFPRTVLLTDPRDANGVPEDMFPAVLKPRFGFNSRSVCLVPAPDRLRALLADQQARYRALPKEDGTAPDFVLEEYVAGTEHTIETLVRDGRPLFHLLSDKQPMAPPFFVEVGDLMPSALPQEDQQACRAATATAISRLGILNGWTHTEIRLHRGRAVVIECAARMGGGYFEQMIETVYGIDRMGILIDLHLGGVRPGDPQPRCWVAARRYVLSGRQQVHALENGTQLFRDPDLRLVWPARVHDIPRLVVGPPEDFDNTVFEFLARGPTGAAATQRADAVLRRAVVSRAPAPDGAAQP